MSEPPADDVLVARPSEGVALVTIDGDRRFNTLRVATLEALGAVVEALAADASVRAMVLTGAGGRAFAAGADLREVASLTPREALAFAARGQWVLDRLETACPPVIAAIDGVCMGGGLDLALACDVRYASPASRFAHPGAARGILTGFGGTARLARLVGRAPALELFASGATIAADTALAIGLVDRVVAAPLETALATAAAIAARPAGEVAATKAAAVRAFRSGRV